MCVYIFVIEYCMYIFLNRSAKTIFYRYDTGRAIETGFRPVKPLQWLPSTRMRRQKSQRRNAVR